MSISVLLPIHKSDSNFDIAFESLVQQSYGDFEILIIANSLDPNFHKFMKTYESLDGRVRVINIEVPGIANALNQGIMLAKHDVIARMDADDVAHVDRFKIQYSLIMSGHYDVIGSNCRLVDENGAIIGFTDLPLNNSDIRKQLSINNVIAHPSVMLKKDIVIRAGGYSYGAYPEDWALWLKLRRDERVVFKNVKEHMIDYRQHNGQSTAGSNYKNNLSCQAGMLISNGLIDRDIRLLSKGFFNALRSLTIR